MRIELPFDPMKSPDLMIRAVFADDSAATLWCLWKREHVVDQYFNEEVYWVARSLALKKYDDPSELSRAFSDAVIGNCATNFQPNDIRSFCAKHFDVLTGKEPFEWEYVAA